MNLESNPQDSAVERFRRNAAPSEFEFPLPRGFSTPFEVTQQGKELVEKTWEAFREKLDGGRGLPELRIVEEYLSRFEQELEEQANEKFGEVGRWYRLGNFEEEKRLEFVGWYEHQIHLTFQGGYIPPLWKELHPTEREWLIRVRRVAQRLRDAARGAAFRRAVLRNLLWEHVMYGEARKWEEIPEDEREDMTESDMPECFISYAEKDQKFAQKLHDDLEDKGIRCWIASEEIRIGEEFRSVIEEAIHRCKKVLLILSEDSIKSEWVKDEVEAALEKERADGRAVLLPIRIDEAVQSTGQAWAAKLSR